VDAIDIGDKHPLLDKMGVVPLAALIARGYIEPFLLIVFQTQGLSMLASPYHQFACKKEQSLLFFDMLLK